MFKKTITRKKNKNYQKGLRFEYRVKKHFEKQGYYVVRMYASKGPADLIAILKVGDLCGKSMIFFPRVKLIQCKNWKKDRKLTPSEHNNLFYLAQQTGGERVLAKNLNHKLVLETLTDPLIIDEEVKKTRKKRVSKKMKQTLNPLLDPTL